MEIVSSKPTITRKELEGVLDCLIKDELVTGSTVKTFESAIADLVGLKYVLATSSVTAAWHLVFSALELDGESEVILPSFFPQAALNALKMTGANPVLVDCDENSPFPAIEDIKAKITEKTKAVAISHLFGYHANTSELYELPVPVIEDISPAIGTEIDDEPVGHGAAFCIMSFSPNMILTTGSGGMVLTGNSRYFSTMRDLRGGKDGQLNYDCMMTDFQGAMGISQLMKLKSFLKRRRNIAKIYSDALRITSHKSLFIYDDSFAYQGYPVIFDSPAEKASKFWKKNGIELAKALEHPLHSILGLRGLDYPNSDRLSKKLYAIPLYPTLTKKEIEKVAKSLSSFI